MSGAAPDHPGVAEVDAVLPGVAKARLIGVVRLSKPQTEAADVIVTVLSDTALVLREVETAGLGVAAAA